MKKLFAILLCLVLVLSLAACAQKPQTDAPQTEPPQTDDATQAPADSQTQDDPQPAQSTEGEVITLNVTSWRTDDAAYWAEINAAFHAQYPNIEVIFNGVTATEYDSVLQTKLQSGNAEDIMFLRTFGTGKQIYEAGYLVDLGEDVIPNLSKIDDAYEAPWTSEAGVVYGVPGSMCVGGFFYNKGIFDAVGVSVPETWAEFLDVCQKLEDAGYIAVAHGLKDSWHTTEYINATITPVATGGSAWHAKLMAREVDYTDAGFVKGMDWIRQLAEYFPDGYEGIGYDDNQMLFLSEAAAIYPSGSFDLGYLQTTNPDIDLGWFFMPVENAGDAVSINFNCIMGYGVNAALKDDPARLEAAFTYLNWLCDDEASSMFNNRILGQYACNTSVSDGIENALAAEILAGTSGADLFQQIPYQQVSDQSPDYTTVVTQAICDMLIGGKAPADVCAEMVAQQSWYFGK